MGRHHGLLTLEQALCYAAELRVPYASADERNRAITRVVEELDLTPQRANRVDKLSGGQRKRASVAMELLTSPPLLILDEPTSGLDPALDRHVMTKLRQLADATATRNTWKPPKKPTRNSGKPSKKPMN